MAFWKNLPRLGIDLRPRPQLRSSLLFPIVLGWALLLGAGLLHAQNAATVVYVEGEARLTGARLTGTGTEVTTRETEDTKSEIGLPVPADATLELGRSGYVEIATGDSTLRLVGPGTFELSTLIAGSSEARGLVASMGSRMRRLLADRERPGLAAAGVRGDFAGDEAWGMGSPAQDLRLAAVDSLRAGDKAMAQELYREAILYATGTEALQLRVELAELLLSDSRYGDAATIISEVDPEILDPAVYEDSQWIGRYYLSRTVSLIGAGHLERAVEVARQTRRQKLNSETQQTIELLAADAALQAGLTGAAVEALEAAIAITPDTPEATAARRLLAGVQE